MSLINQAGSINQKMVEHFSSESTAVDAVIKVPVDVTPGSMITDMAQLLLTELYRLDRGNLIERFGVNEDLIRKYLLTIIYLRVSHVNGIDNQASRSYRSLLRRVTTPVLLYNLLIAIGKVHDIDYNIVFYPTYCIDSEDLLSPEELRTLSEFLYGFESLAVVKGIPVAEDGILDFMAMAVVGNQVRSYKQSHPVYAFLAAFLEAKEVNDVTGSMMRIYYGSVDDFKLHLHEVMRSLSVREA